MIETDSERDTAILKAATQIIRDQGLPALTRARIAQVAAISPASVSNFGRTSITNSAPPAEGFKHRIMSALLDVAIRVDDLPMIRVGVIGGFVRREDLPETVRDRAGV